MSNNQQALIVNGTPQKQDVSDPENISRKPTSLAREQNLATKARLANLKKAREAIQRNAEMRRQALNSQNSQLNLVIKETEELPIKRGREDFTIDEITAEDLGYVLGENQPPHKKYKIDVEPIITKPSHSFLISMARTGLSIITTIGVSYFIKRFLSNESPPQNINHGDYYDFPVERAQFKPPQVSSDIYYGQSILR